MYIHTTPTTLDKLRLMGDATRFEPAGDTPQREALTLQSRPAC